MELDPLPRLATWRHVDARDGFEVLFAAETPRGHLLRGQTTAIEDGVSWTVSYRLETDSSWRSSRLDVHATIADGESTLVVEKDEDGWTVNGIVDPTLDGCVDVDLESSAVTNTLPVHRLDLRSGGVHDVPAVFVRADSLRVERLAQTYELRDSATADGGFEVAYSSATFGFAATLRYDTSGLVVEYPGLATRHS